MEIVSGIHRIDGIKGVNCYLIASREHLLMIDTGLPGQEQRSLKYIEMKGWKPTDISYIILTHADIDHIGCARRLREMTGAKVAIHGGDIPIITGGQDFKTINSCFSPLVKLVMKGMHFQPLEPDIILSDGDQIEGWHIVHTPGHTPGSICVYQPGLHIFVGDALRTNSKQVARPISRRICVDLALVRKSLTAISNLQYSNLFPGHGAPIIGQGASRIKEMLVRYANSPKLNG
jgi:hydroxyacylglutathione hydrolase